MEPFWSGATLFRFTSDWLTQTLILVPVEVTQVILPSGDQLNIIGHMRSLYAPSYDFGF